MTELEKLTKRKCWNIVADIWLKDYKNAINNRINSRTISEYFGTLKGFIWGLYCSKKITETQKDKIINELLDMWEN